MNAKFVWALFIFVFLGFCADGFAQELAWQKETLAAHNKHRSQCGVPPLTWDSDLAAKAQQWADGCTFDASSPQEPASYQENRSTIPDVPKTDPWYRGRPFIVDDWYGGRDSYDPAFVLKWRARQFARVIWRNSARLGCGRAMCWEGPTLELPMEKKYMWTVCRYSPAGNMSDRDQLQKNVPQECPAP